MTTKKISITRALKELSLSDDKISRLSIESQIFIQKGTTRPEVLGKPGLTLDTAKEEAQSNFDKLQAAIQYRSSIKSAITLSNAVTMVTVAGETMAVAVAIEKKRY